MAKELGIKVQLHGANGDNAVSHGVGRLIELAQTLHWVKLAMEAERYASHFSIPHGKMTYYYLRNYSCLKPLFDVLRILKGKFFQKPHRPNLLNPLFAEKMKDVERLEKYANLPLEKSCAEQSLTIRELTSPYNQVGLSLLDKSAAYFSVEKRYPFWDKRLILFCLSLPSEQKLDGGWDRVIMRRAMEPLLPPSVCWRQGKANMSENADTICRKLISWYDLLNTDSFNKTGKYINMERAYGILKTFKEDIHVEGTMYLYNILGLMLWVTLSEEYSGRES